STPSSLLRCLVSLFFSFFRWPPTSRPIRISWRKSRRCSHSSFSHRRTRVPCRSWVRLVPRPIRSSTSSAVENSPRTAASDSRTGLRCFSWFWRCSSCSPSSSTSSAASSATKRKSTTVSPELRTRPRPDLIDSYRLPLPSGTVSSTNLCLFN
ncbi:hypothetical protein PENTCL1PPCAC_24680, partial [Pristionchus entomophagus]